MRRCLETASGHMDKLTQMGHDKRKLQDSNLMDDVTRSLDQGATPTPNTVRHVIHYLVRYVWSGDNRTSGDALRDPSVVTFVRRLTSDLVCGNQVIDGLRDAFPNIHHSQRGQELCEQVARIVDVWFIDRDKYSDGTRDILLVNIDSQCMISMGPGFIQLLMSLWLTGQIYFAV